VHGSSGAAFVALLAPSKVWPVGHGLLPPPPRVSHPHLTHTVLVHLLLWDAVNLLSGIIIAYIWTFRYLRTR
jgi:hypothetical protein